MMGMKTIIGSKTRVKLLTLFLLNPEGKFYVREITRKTQENINSVRRELKKLEGIGLLESEIAGNMKYYTVNRKMPIYEELKRIFLKTEGIGKAIKENLTKLGEIEVAFIYGSFAKDEERLSSDIDLMIVGSIDEKRLIPLIRELEDKLSREINYVIFTPREFKSRIKEKDPFVSNVLKEDRIMLIGDPSELR